MKWIDGKADWCLECGGDGYVTQSCPCPSCTPPAPRAVIATTPDRRWVAALAPTPERQNWAAGCVPDPEPVDAYWWHYYEWSDEAATLVESDTYDQDTGQDAADMVAAFAEKKRPYRVRDEDEE